MKTCCGTNLTTVRLEGKFEDLCAAVVQKQGYSVSENSFTSLHDEIQHDDEMSGTGDVESKWR